MTKQVLSSFDKCKKKAVTLNYQTIQSSSLGGVKRVERPIVKADLFSG